ncbi:hypothetical protein BC937DRAFT_94769 [Endogone sp. FLAS-F59071]|nr:hypothetical protein BC937DRAFT_94769 [Endogone sp. FLAS-F59071]|eukprot:RUS20621.1 hypothetical protein BC937DRAFT_94769 [Endogone sp. FLAS-F59071]
MPVRPTAIVRFATEPSRRFPIDDGPSLDFVGFLLLTFPFYSASVPCRFYSLNNSIQFITRSKVISLYRDILRTLKKQQSDFLPLVPTLLPPLGVDKRDAQEMKVWARSDIERYRHETDSGVAEFHTIKSSLMLAQATKEYRPKKS